MKPDKKEESRFHHPFNPPRRNTSKTWGPSATKQEFAREADINVLVGKYGIGPLARFAGEQFFFDATAVPDYHTGMNRLSRAQEQFEALPAKLRARFNHDPAKLVGFLMDPTNKDEAIKLGLVNAPPPAPPRRAGGGEQGPQGGDQVKPGLSSGTRAPSACAELGTGPPESEALPRPKDSGPRAA